MHGVLGCGWDAFGASCGSCYLGLIGVRWLRPSESVRRRRWSAGALAALLCLAIVQEACKDKEEVCSFNELSCG